MEKVEDNAAWQTMAHEQICPLPIFVNEMWPEHSDAHLFTYCLWLLSRAIAELRSCHRDCMACKTKNIYCLYYICHLCITSIEKVCQSRQSFYLTHIRLTLLSCDIPPLPVPKPSRGPLIFPCPEYSYSEDTHKEDCKLLEGETDLAHFFIILNLVHNTHSSSP